MIKDRQRRPRQKFLAVDVFRTSFGEVSESAVYDVYSTLFDVPKSKIRKHLFPTYVKALRDYYKPGWTKSDLKRN